MRIVVMSDSHGMFGSLQKIVEAQPDADMYIHLGDGASECKMLKEEYSDKTFYFLKGNCDFSSNSPNFQIIQAGSHKIFATHGHNFSVNYSKSILLMEAKDNDCDIVLFGHTHERFNSYEDGIHILNPGSCSCPRDGNRPSYAFIDIVGDGVMKNIVSL